MFSLDTCLDIITQANYVMVNQRALASRQYECTECSFSTRLCDNGIKYKKPWTITWQGYIIRIHWNTNSRQTLTYASDIFRAFSDHPVLLQNILDIMQEGILGMIPPLNLLYAICSLSSFSAAVQTLTINK